ncbi:MAG: hypothetical protein ACOZNI_05115 [Myxococcota bacterium]
MDRRSLRLAALALFVLVFAFASRASAEDDDATAGADAAPAAPAEAGEAEGEEEEGEKKVYEAPEKVSMGIHLNDIQSIDLKSHSYAMDFYVWFRWKNPDLDPATSMEIANPIELWGLMVTPIYEEPEELDDGTLYQVLRVQGTFSKKLPLYNYPFDRQSLEVIFEDGANDTSALVYVADGAATVNPTLKLPGYAVGAPSFDVSAWHYPTAFGDPRTAPNTSYSRATLSVPISRPPVAYASKLFLPVVCVMVCAALMFLLSPALADARVDVGITSLLTIVALQMTYNDALPDVGYLMLMDKVYLLAYGFVIVGLAVVVHTTRMAERGETERAIGLHRKILGVISSAWAIAMIVLVSKAMQEG